MQKPLATVVIGGLLSATLLTLVVLPVLYSLVAGRTPKSTVKPSAAVPTALLIILLSMVAAQSRGQGVQPLRLAQALDQASRQSLLLRGSALEAESQRTLIGAAFDPARTNVEVQLGQTQASPVDYILGATQQFALPSFYRAQKQLYQSAATSAERRLALRRLQLRTTIKQAYYQLVFDDRLTSLLRRQDSLYARAARAAAVRYRTGETNRLGQVSADTRLQSVRLRQLILRADTEAHRRTLQLLLNTTDSVTIDTTLTLRRELPAGPADALNRANATGEGNPALAVLQQDRTLSRNQTDLERQRLKPDLFVGYYTQSILHESGYNVVQAGVAVPIFRQATKARIAAARINEQITDNSFTYTQAQLTGQLTILEGRAEALRASLRYFEQSALPQARLIQTTAAKSYQAGEIDYVEFFGAVQQAFSIEEDYLNAVFTYTDVIIQLEQLFGVE